MYMFSSHTPKLSLHILNRKNADMGKLPKNWKLLNLEVGR